jgi:hypothetical protein
VVKVIPLSGEPLLKSYEVYSALHVDDIYTITMLHVETYAPPATASISTVGRWT